MALRIQTIDLPAFSMREPASPLGTLRPGEVVQARVVAMLRDGVARLEIGGEVLEVAGAVRLPVGSTVGLMLATGGDGMLMLVLKAPARAITEPADTAEPAGSGPGIIRSGNLASTLLALSQSGQLGTATPRERSAPADAETDPPHRTATTHAQPAEPATPDDGQLPSETRAAAPAVTAPPHTSLVTFQVPGIPQPLMLLLERDDHEARADGASAVEARPWTLGLAVDVPGLGPVHALLTLRGKSLGMHLDVEREHAAAILQRDSDELRRELQEAALLLEALAVNVAPPADSRHAGTEQLSKPIGSPRP